MTPLVIIIWMASTSLVIRVIRRPTGVRSKKPRWSRWILVNISRRRS